jgi:hypothetical protein
MRLSINIPNFGDFADPRNVAKVAAAASPGASFRGPLDAVDGGRTGDLTHSAGHTLLTPVPRYRPQQLARQVATLDHLSGGRVTFAAGLGGPVEDEYRSFGDTADPRLLAERLDEGLELLRSLWTGRPVNHHGRHYQAENVTLLPATVQQPGPPVWIGGFWPRRPPHAAGSPLGRRGTALRDGPARSRT